MKGRYIPELALLIITLILSPVLNGQKISIFSTIKGDDIKFRLTDSVRLEQSGQPTENQPCIFIEPFNRFQTFIGIGGALTDASAEVFATLPEQIKGEFLKAYYDKVDGIAYTLGRTNIASCDFSSSSYSYVEKQDPSLDSFTIEHDKKFKIPFIKRAILSAGGKLTLFASPWSPPAWMKENKDVLNGGKLLPKYYDTWANHFVKFINSYEKEGIPIWGISVQNEPMAVQRWESCIYTATEERDFIKNNLGPKFTKNDMSNKKIIAWDHNRDLIFHRANILLNDKEAAKYIWGIGFHWYETWTGGDMQFENLKRVKEAFPNINLIFTEGCPENFNLDRIQNWSLGEHYAHSMIGDFNSGTVAWCDWNILLDEKGGPNHVGNFCFAPIHANTQTGELIYTNSYYYIGHFSKFIKPGARRISSSSNRIKLETTAFLNPDGKKIIIVLNRSEDTISFKLILNGLAASIDSKAHSIITIVI